MALSKGEAVYPSLWDPALLFAYLHYIPCFQFVAQVGFNSCVLHTFVTLHKFW